MKIFLSIFLFIFNFSICIGQSEYKFDYQYFVYNDGIMFVDTVLNVSFLLDYDGSLSTKSLRKIPEGRKFYRDELVEISEQKFHEKISQVNLSNLSDYTYQLQKVEDSWIYLEVDVDDGDVSFSRLNMKSYMINDDIFCVGFSKDDWEYVFIMNMNGNPLGMNEVGIFDHQKKINLSNPTYKEIKEKIGIQHSNDSRYRSLDFMSFSDGRAIIVDQSKRKTLRYNKDIFDSNYNLGLGIGFHSVEQEYSSQALKVINKSNTIEHLENYEGRFYRDSSDMEKEIYYVHFHKNLIAKIEIDKKDRLKIIDFETLIPIKEKNKVHVYIGDQIFITEEKEELVIVSNYGVLKNVKNEKVDSLFRSTKLNLYQMGVSISKQGDKYFLYDQAGQNLLLDDAFDNIKYNGRYISASKGSEKYLFNSQFKKLDVSRAKHWQLVSYSPQMIDKQTGELLYIDYHNNFLVKPENSDIGICGTGFTSTYSAYNKVDENSFERLDSALLRRHYTMPDFAINKFKFEKRYTFTFEADSIKNLIQQEDISGNEYFEQAVLSFSERRFVPSNLFIYYKNGKKGLANQSVYNFQENTIEVKSFFEYDKDVTFEYFDSVHPIKFSHSGLNGYVGINLSAFAAELGKFEGSYARFKLPNGDSGWLSKTGEIIHD